MSSAPTIDLRSDTVTRPCAAMRRAMAQAVVGDDGFEDDPTQAALEAEIAAMLGKETAVFVPSGTMANQLAIRLQTRPGDQVLAHAASHIVDHEYGGAAVLSGVSVRTFDSDDGHLPLDAVAAVLDLAARDRLAPVALVCLENTHNDRGGVPLPAGHAESLAALVRPAGVAMHLDGARLFNAAAATGRSVAALAEPFDTVSVCMSKGLGAPAGSLLCGPLALRREARRVRRYLGGMMRQTGVLAAAALHGLHHHRAGLSDDHRRAAQLGATLAAIPGVTVRGPATNLVWFTLADGHPVRARGPDLVARLREVGVRITGDGVTFRAVTHRDIDDAGLARASDALVSALRSSPGPT